MNKTAAAILLMVGAVLSDATEAKQQITPGPSYDGTLNNKNEPRQLIDEDIQQTEQREWTNKLVVYKYRLIRLARLGIRQYKLKTKAIPLFTTRTITDSRSTI